MIQETAVELFLSVRDNLGTFARFHGLRAAEIRARAERVMDEFGLAPEAHRKVMDLSGGFKRRVQVAKVFMVDTPVVFLDEFSTGMDPILKRSVMDKLRREAAGGRTIVLTTQILSEVEELCDDILILNRGRQAARGDLHTLKLLVAGRLRRHGDLRSAAVGDRGGAGGAPSDPAVGDAQHRRDDAEGRPRRHPGRGRRARRARARAASRGRWREPRGHFRRADEGGAARGGCGTRRPS